MRAAYWDDPDGRGRRAAIALLGDRDVEPVAELDRLLTRGGTVVVPLEDDLLGIQRSVVDALLRDERRSVQAAHEVPGTPATRWILVDDGPPEHAGAAATLLFVVPRADRPGALAAILVAFSSRGRNVARMEPRPLGGLGAFGFLLEVEGTRRDPVVAEALDEVAAACQRVRVLGELAAASTPAGELEPTVRATGATLRIGVVGLGLIGGSLAHDLLAQGATVLGLDPLAAAPPERGVWDRIQHVEDVATLAGGVDLAVVATPLGVADDVVRALRAVAPDLPITDVGSIKTAFVAEFTDDALVVGGHPMAGTERTGFAAARPGLFVDAPWLLTPTVEFGVTALAAVVELALAVGARPLVLSAADHDRAVATVSHAPHLLAYALHHVATSGGDLGPVAGPSFRDMTRVAASDPAFWTDLLQRNRPAVEVTVRRLLDWLDAATTEDADALRDRLAAARRGASAEPAGGEWLPLIDGAVGVLRGHGAAGRAITALRRGDDGTVEVRV